MKFEINNIEWQIFELDGLDTRLSANGEYCSGVCAFDKKAIYLHKDTTKTYKYKILLHELSHAFINDCLLSKPKKFTEEEVCEFTALYSQTIIELADEYFRGGAK